MRIKATRGNEGAKSIKLTAFRENPLNGGSPAKLRRRRAVALNLDGDIFFKVAVVLGEEVREVKKRRRSGVIIIIYPIKYPVAAGAEIDEIASIQPIWAIEE